MHTEETDEIMRQRYPEEGESLSKELGVSPLTIRKWASRLKVKKLSATKNEGYFDEWSASMAYDLGYIWADGNIIRKGVVHRLQLECKTEDECILQGIAGRLATSRKIVRRLRATTANRPDMIRSYSKLTIDSSVIVARLIELGVECRKTYTNPPHPEVPTHLLSHFYRGILDGNGSATRSARSTGQISFKLSFLGHENTMLTIRENLSESLGIRLPAASRKRPDSDLVYFSWTGIDDLSALHGYLYPRGQCFPFLERKRRKLESYLIEKGVQLWR